MAVEIRELIIKAIVADQANGPGNGQSSGSGNSTGSGAEKSLKLSVEKVLEIIRNKNER